MVDEERGLPPPKPWERAALDVANAATSLPPAHFVDPSAKPPVAPPSASDDDVDPSACSAGRVSHTVLQAARFMQHPSVRAMGRDEMRAFLRSNGLRAYDVDQAFALAAASARSTARAWPSHGNAPPDHPAIGLASSALTAVGAASGVARRSRLARAVLVCVLAAIAGFALCRLVLALAVRQRRRPRLDAPAPPAGSAAAAVPALGGEESSVAALGVRTASRTPDAAVSVGAAVPTATRVRMAVGADGYANAEDGLGDAVAELRVALAQLADSSDQLADDARVDGRTHAPDARAGSASVRREGASERHALAIRTLLVHVNNALGCCGSGSASGAGVDTSIASPPRINARSFHLARVWSAGLARFLAAIGARYRQASRRALVCLARIADHRVGLTRPETAPSPALQGTR